MSSHRFRKSIKYNSRRGCPPGFHKRTAYTVKHTHKFVPARCVRSTTKYSETQRQFKKRLNQRASRRISRSLSARASIANIPGEKTISCPEGMIARKGYVRHFRNTVRREGYNQVRKGKIIHVMPAARDIYVKPGCIKNRGKEGKGVNTGKPLIGPLRQGELVKHGYSTEKSVVERHQALTRAMREFGALGVFRKLDAVAKLTTRTSPETSRKFSTDRDWIRSHYNLKAF